MASYLHTVLAITGIADYSIRGKIYENIICDSKAQGCPYW